MKIYKNNSNSVFDNVLHTYKNTFNNNKLLNKIFIKKRKYYNKPKNFYYKKYI